MVLYQRMTENISFTAGLDCSLQVNSFVEVWQLQSPAKWTYTHSPVSSQGYGRPSDVEVFVENLKVNIRISFLVI
jgi:hypothetical protein